MIEDLEQHLADLVFEVDHARLVPLTMRTKSGWTRHSTRVELLASNPEDKAEASSAVFGAGEDVTYEAEDQLAFQQFGPPAGIEGVWKLGDFSQWLDEQARDHFFAGAAMPTREESRSYRRWAFESAALDLALAQNGVTLSELYQDPKPLRYVVSMGLGAKPSTEGLAYVRSRVPEAEFKIDFSEAWTLDTVRELADFGPGIAVVDFKAHYHGSFQGPAPSAELYRAVAEALPSTWLEDPAWDGDAWDVLDGDLRSRVSWDAVLHRAADLEGLPARPGAINIKPSRFGSLRELFGAYRWCEREGVDVYGGGQFELDVGRRHIQELASLFHASGPNDVSPVVFHRLTEGSSAGEEGSLEEPASSPLATSCAASQVPGFGR